MATDLLNAGKKQDREIKLEAAMKIGQLDVSLPIKIFTKLSFHLVKKVLSNLKTHQQNKRVQKIKSQMVTLKHGSVPRLETAHSCAVAAPTACQLTWPAVNASNANFELS